MSQEVRRAGRAQGWRGEALRRGLQPCIHTVACGSVELLSEPAREASQKGGSALRDW